MIGGQAISAANNVGVLVADPGAGNQFVYTFPAGYQALVVAVRYTLTADATVINRYFGLDLRPAAVTSYRLQMAIAVTAGVASTAIWTAGSSAVELVGANVRQHTLPYPMVFNPGDTLQSDVVSLQAGDAITAIQLNYLRQPLTG